MAYTGVRRGTFATYRGREFEARPPRPDGTVLLRSFAAENPDPATFQRNERLGAWQVRVAATDLDRLFQANAYARYQGHRVNVESVDQAGTARVYSADGEGLWAEENGFTPVEKYVYRKEVPVWELADVHEEQHDLLFDRWREATFTRPQGAR